MSEDGRTEPSKWPQEQGDSRADDDPLVVDVSGFEGPLDVLLAMARTQKVDLASISILDLVEQYLGFIQQARALRLELAADYLVMAAWLAFLKSRLLLPAAVDDAEQPDAEELARQLAFRLRRLHAMREQGEALMTRPRLNQDVFGRGFSEPVERQTTTVYSAELIDLLKAYGRRRQTRSAQQSVHRIARRRVWSIKQARERLEDLLGQALNDWMDLDGYLCAYVATPQDQRTVRAASFGASLEMAREGKLELRQTAAFAPLYLRRRKAGDQDATSPEERT